MSNAEHAGASSHVTPPVISLLPLNATDHGAALQQVYQATPGYWQMYNLPGAPAQRATEDLHEAAEVAGRTMLGIARHLSATDENNLSAETPGENDSPSDSPGVELVGVMDFRLHWPDPQVVYLGMVMVAEPYQRQGIGSAAWRLLAPWLAQTAAMSLARTGVEQFNPAAMRFFQSIGFGLTGASSRIQSGNRWVRLLYMEQPLASTSTAAAPDSPTT